MKFKIHWIENHVLEVPLKRNFEINKTIEKKMIKDVLYNLPKGSNCQGAVYGDDVYEFECFDTFEANSIEEAQKKAFEYDTGENGVFTVFDMKGKKLFTEEGIEQTV